MRPSATDNTFLFKEAQSIPSISLPSALKSTTYILICLDLDAPFPSFGVLGPILHAIQPGYKALESESQPPSTLKTDEPFVANYIGPAPPPGSSPHRYAFFLYEQPVEFDGKKFAPPDGKPLGNMNRMRFDLDSWEKKAGLGNMISMNFFKSN